MRRDRHLRYLSDRIGSESIFFSRTAFSYLTVKQPAIDLPLLYLIHSCTTHSLTKLQIKLHSNVLRTVSKRRFNTFSCVVYCRRAEKAPFYLWPGSSDTLHTRERDLCAVTMTNWLKRALFNDGTNVYTETRFGICAVGRWEIRELSILEKYHFKLKT